MAKIHMVLLSGLLASSTLLLQACAPADDAQAEVSYQNDVVPVLKENCLRCHVPGTGEGFLKSGLDMTSHENLMKGTKFGPVIQAGNSTDSTLIRMIEGRVDPSIQMPHGGRPLSKTDIATIKTWVEQGAKNN